MRKENMTTQQHSRAEQFTDILWYTWPEVGTAFVLHVLPRILESGFIGTLKSTSLFATMAVVTTLIHFIMKVAEGLSVGTLVLVGKHNGVGEYKEAGRTLSDAFWVSVVIGALISALIFFGARVILILFRVPEKMVLLGVPYLKLRALSIFFNFVYFTFVGFLRGIKNTRVPMVIFAAGAAIFIFTSYPLIFGYWGFPELGFQGAALAGVIQFAFMTLAAAAYVIFHSSTNRYEISLQKKINIDRSKQLLRISAPIMLDKATMAVVPMWLAACLNPFGKIVTAGFGVIKDMERVVLLFANGLAQVSTLLISNHLGTHNWHAVRLIIRRILILLVIASIISLFVSLGFSRWLINFFDPKHKFIDFSISAFMLLGPLMLFDCLQLVLSGMLRGAAQVNVVMMTRLVVIFGFFIPVTYVISRITMESALMQFFSIYVIFYVSTAIMSGVYWWFIRQRMIKRN